MSKSTIQLVNINGSIVVEPKSNYPVIDHLPAAIYTIGMIGDPMSPQLAFKKERDKFTLPAKIYGKNTRYYDAISSSFRSREGSTGALLVGKAGSGKTLLTEQLANWFVSADRPVFWIKEKSIPVSLIHMAIQIAGPNGCMVIFDELSKVYPENNSSGGNTQDSLLTLLSDSDLKKVMFLATDNSSRSVNDYLLNRPGRFLYWIEFGGLSKEEAIEYCVDLKVSPEMTSEIAYYVGKCTITYDILKVIVDVALTATDIEDFKFKLDILNVPTVTWKTYSISRINNLEDATVEIPSANLTVSDLENIEIDFPTGETYHFSATEIEMVSSNMGVIRKGKYDIRLLVSDNSEKPKDVYHSAYKAKPKDPETSKAVVGALQNYLFNHTPALRTE